MTRLYPFLSGVIGALLFLPATGTATPASRLESLAPSIDQLPSELPVVEFEEVSIDQEVRDLSMVLLGHERSPDAPDLNTSTFIYYEEPAGKLWVDKASGHMKWRKAGYDASWGRQDIPPADRDIAALRAKARAFLTDTGIIKVHPDEKLVFVDKRTEYVRGIKPTDREDDGIRLPISIILRFRREILGYRVYGGGYAVVLFGPGQSITGADALWRPLRAIKHARRPPGESVVGQLLASLDELEHDLRHESSEIDTEDTEIAFITSTRAYAQKRALLSLHVPAWFYHSDMASRSTQRIPVVARLWSPVEQTEGIVSSVDLFVDEQEERPLLPPPQDD